MIKCFANKIPSICHSKWGQDDSGGASLLLELEEFPPSLSGNWVRPCVLVMVISSEKMIFFFKIERWYCHSYYKVQ